MNVRENERYPSDKIMQHDRWYSPINRESFAICSPDRTYCSRRDGRMLDGAAGRSKTSRSYRSSATDRNGDSINWRFESSLRESLPMRDRRSLRSNSKEAARAALVTVDSFRAMIIKPRAADTETPARCGLGRTVPEHPRNFRKARTRNQPRASELCSMGNAWHFVATARR